MPVNTQWVWRDGVGGNVLGGVLYMFGGWNPAGGSGFDGDNGTTNEVWKSINDGLTWTLLGRATWPQRHTMGHCVLDGKIWVFGGELINGISQQDIWNWTGTGAWTQVTNAWGTIGGNRNLFAYCVHKGEIYMAGGQEQMSTPFNMFTDIVKLVGSSFVSVGTLPLSYFSTGAMVSDGTNIYIYGGGRYNSSGSGHDNMNSNVYKSADDGVTWELVGTLPPAAIGLMYCGGTYTDSMGGMLWFLSGSAAAGGGNQSGIWCSRDNGVTWIKFTGLFPANHAAALCTNADQKKLYIMSGNLENAVAMIENITI